MRLLILLIFLSRSRFLIFWIYWILYYASARMYFWWKLELELNLRFRTSVWSFKENDESIYPPPYCTRNNDLFDNDTQLHVYMQCRIGHCCTMYHEASSPLWRNRFWKFNHSTITAYNFHIPNCNHCTWGRQEILISPGVHLMKSQIYIHLSSTSLTNEEDYLQNKEHFILVTLSH